MPTLISSVEAITRLKIKDHPRRGTRVVTKIAVWGDVVVGLTPDGYLMPMTHRFGRSIRRIDGGNINRWSRRKYLGWVGDFLRCACLLDQLDTSAFEEWETIHKARDDRNQKRDSARYLVEQLEEGDFPVPAKLRRLAEEPDEEAEEPSGG